MDRCEGCGLPIRPAQEAAVPAGWIHTTTGSRWCHVQEATPAFPASAVISELLTLGWGAQHIAARYRVSRDRVRAAIQRNQLGSERRTA